MVLKKQLNDIIEGDDINLSGSIPALGTYKTQLEPEKTGFFVVRKKTVPKNVPKRKRFLRMRTPYMLPIIIRSKNGDWFVKYWYEYPDQPGEFKEFRVRDGINYIKDLSEKEKAIKELREDIEFSLIHSGYNPFKQHKSVKKQIEDKRIAYEKANWSIEFAIENFMEFCKWKKLSRNTIRTYQTFINNFSEWLSDKNKLTVPASKLIETDCINFLDTYNDAEDWAPRTYNNHVKFFTTLFNRIEKLEKRHDREIKYAINLDELEEKTDKAEKNRAYSGIVAKQVKKELNDSKFDKLKNFIEFIYLSCMRPKEIRLLKIQHINLENKQIKVIGPDGKTGDRFVPISVELSDLLVKLEFDKYPLNHYLFGKLGIPSEQIISKCYFSDQYAVIKKKLSLDKNYTMYGWKHTRVIDLASAGFTDNEIMKLTGHTNYQSFLAYKRDLVVDTTVMTGKTIGF